MMDGSKAAWLIRVRDSDLRCYVPPFYVLSVREWALHREHCLTQIQRQFRGCLVAVRSSRANECAGTFAQAGRYRSFGAISSSSAEALRVAIASVLHSYGDPSDDDQVLIQAWVGESIAVIGATSSSATPYPNTACISYRVGSETHAITAGWTNVQRFWLASDARPNADWPSAVRRSYALLAWVEAALKLKAVELEIAVDRRGRLRLLQVTPSTRPVSVVSTVRLRKLAARAAAHYQVRAKPREAELGRATIFGLMPDWNPAELMGEHPRALAASIFDALVARRAWREARIGLGYRRSAIHPLVAFIAGRPYVDVRASLNSLLPGSLDAEIVRPVIDASIEKLRRQPSLHDRIETELQPTCMGFADEWRHQLVDAGLSAAARSTWRGALLAMEAIWAMRQSYASSVSAMSDALVAIKRSILFAGDDLRALIKCLDQIEKTIAQPFAADARLAFVARFQLTSLARAGGLTTSRLNEFFHSISVLESPAGIAANASGTQRPSTFDIRVLPMASKALEMRRVVNPMTPTPRERRSIHGLLSHAGIAADSDAWLTLAQQRIELREHTKYLLSDALSCWFSALARCGAERGLSTDDLSHLSVSSLQNHHDATSLLRRADRARALHDHEHAIRMPILISHRRDFVASTDSSLRPTFFGCGRVSGRVQVIDRFTERGSIAPGTIVLISAADPGFDWIFEHQIAALVTCFGGPHSHMAIRCNEISLPCVLGCGETTYQALANARCISIDLEQRHLLIDT
jgi:glutamine kinase